MKKNANPPVGRSLLCFGIFFGIAVCMVACAAKPNPLLEHDHTRMTDTGLVRYFYDLGEAIEECEGSTQGDTTVGIGAGTYGGGGGVGVSIGQGVGSGCNSDPLRQRRVDVRMELKKRGIQP